MLIRSKPRQDYEIPHIDCDGNVVVTKIENVPEDIATFYLFRDMDSAESLVEQRGRRELLKKYITN